MPTILIVDDDPGIRDVVRFAFSKAGFETAEASDGQDAIDQFSAVSPSLVVLDIVMPGMDGLELCQELRRISDVPILFLSSRDEEIDRVVGLEIGADDYLVKPFSPRELVARAKAILRRVSVPPAKVETAPGGNAKLKHRKLSLDLDFVRAEWAGQDVPLTATEFGILRTLMGRPGMVFSRDKLMDGAYSIDKTVSDRTIDSHIRRLRGKFARIGVAPIETLHGFGYRLGSCD